MLESFPAALIAGLILGFLAGLGVGGGSLLILWLTLVLQLPQGTARSINLLFFIAAAGAVSVFRFRKGSLALKSVLPAILGGSISAAMFSLLSLHADVDSFRKLFGLLLLITGVRELCYRPRELR